MSDHELKDLYYHDPFQDDQDHLSGKACMQNQKLPPISGSSSAFNLQGFDPSYMTFTECLQGGTPMDYNSLATAFGLSPSSSEVFSSVDQGNQKQFDLGDHLGGGSNHDQNQVTTPNSSLSYSSTEAGAEEDSEKSKKDEQQKGLEDGGDDSKKV